MLILCPSEKQLHELLLHYKLLIAEVYEPLPQSHSNLWKMHTSIAFLNRRPVFQIAADSQG